jgi:hypothetical protein
MLTVDEENKRGTRMPPETEWRPVLVTSTTCRNRFEIICDPEMESKQMEQWAHIALADWLHGRRQFPKPEVVDLTDPLGYHRSST